MHHNIQPESPSCPQCRQAGFEVMDPLIAVFYPECHIIYPVSNGIPFLFRKASLSAGNCPAGTGKGAKYPDRNRIAL